MNFQGTNAEKIFHGQAKSPASQLFYAESAPLFSKIIRENLGPGTYSLVDLGGYKGEFLSELSKNLQEYKFESIIVDKIDGLDSGVSAKKVVADIINVPLPDKSADIVILRYVLPWDSFENQKLILNEVKRLCNGLCIIQHQGADSNDPVPMQQAALKLFSGNPPRLKRDNGFFTESKQVEKWMDGLQMPYKKVQERKVETLSETFVEKFELNDEEANTVRDVLKGCDYIMQTTWVLNFDINNMEHNVLCKSMVPKNIIFSNEPKLSEYEVHKTFNERRIKLLPLIKNYICNNDRFKNTDTTVTFFPRGVGSIVSLVTTPEKSFVLKVPLSLRYAEGEVEFFSVWERSGVKVPKIYESGKIAEHQYILMEYINTPTIQEKFTERQLIETETFVELGRLLRKLHEPKIQGFGRVIDNKPEFANFDEWISGQEMGDRIQYCKEHSLITEEHVSFDALITILTEHIKNENQSVYCHNDFGVHNIFATSPFTIFDPNPRFNSGYFDLGRALLMGVTKETSIENDQLLRGYFGENSYSEKIVHAFIILNGYYKAPDWHKKKREDYIRGFQGYLLKRKGLL